jgi:adhesin HecA-like repeat protein
LISEKGERHGSFKNGCSYHGDILDNYIFITNFCGRGIERGTSVVTVINGSSFAADVNISGVTDLYDYQFDLSFNPTVLQANNILEGTFLAGGGSTFFIPGAIDNTAGTIAFNADTLLTAISGVSSSGTLLEFKFTALAPGTSDLTILDNADLILQDSTGAIITSAQTGGVVTVQGSMAIPEPSSLMMLGAGLLAIGGLFLKRTIQ